MGMHSYVVGIKPPDAEFRKMLKAYQACEEAGVPIPKEVDKFFGGERPDEAGVVVRLSPSEKGPVQEWRSEEHDTQEGIEVDLRKLSSDIKVIRFINSW
jgi:hypothetical protein